MERARKLATAVITLSIALGAGQYMESLARKRVYVHDLPVNVQPVAASTHQVESAAALALPARHDNPLPRDVPVFARLPDEAATPQPLGRMADGACRATLNLATEPAAVLGLDLQAPCHADERVVIRHAGLAVTGRMSPAGHLAVHLPALDSAGEVSVRFADGTVVAASLPVPDLAGLRRFGVQWIGNDSFQIEARATTAPSGEPNHVSAVDPHRPGDREGFLSLLGDGEVPLPMLAEVYTFPADGAAASVAVEAPVTDKTCGRELLGDALESFGGRPRVTEITLAMPPCDAVGGYILLNNPGSDLNMLASR